jgi:outer membrane protein assembly factor BamB
MCFVAGSTQLAVAQQTTEAAVADSPTARALLEDLEAQAKENPNEAARIARRLLDEYGDVLLRTGDAREELFRSAADAVEDRLLADTTLLARFRELETRSARTMLLERGADETAHRRRLTEAGLEASLELIEQQLMEDRAQDALTSIARIAKHPDLVEDRARAAHAFEALAAARLGLDAKRDEALRKVRALGGSPQVQQNIERMVRETTPRALLSSQRVRAVLSHADSAEVPTAAWRQIWEMPLERALYRRLYEGTRETDAASRNARNSATFLTTAPVVRGSIIYLNDGESVRAIDADSREELWSRSLGLSGADREVGTVSDLSSIAVDDDALVSFVGHAFSNARSGAARVWCLEPSDGGVRWTIDLDGLEGRAELQGLFPVASPILTTDAAIILARKPTQRLEQVDWIVALDRRDGHVRWARSIAGAPGTRAIAGRRQAGMTLDGDAVIVGTPLGAVARVRVGDGGVDWLRRFPVPLREARFSAEPWEQAAPVVVGDRVVWISPEEAEVVALERTSGRVLESRPIGPGSAWASPRYLAAIESPSAGGENAQPLVLGIGSDVVAFDANDLTKRRWALSELLTANGVRRTGADNRQGIRGRVTTAGSHLLIPGIDDALILDATSGRVDAVLLEQSPANAVMCDDRVVAAGDLSLRVLMPPDRAEEILRARLARSPQDPAAAVALMMLALRSERPAIALEAAEAARRAIAGGAGTDAVRAELLESLLGIAAAHAEFASRAFEIAAFLADTPARSVRVEFARGDAQRAGGDAKSAVFIWRSIASDERLSNELLSFDGVDRSVRMEALRRIARATARDTELTQILEDEARAALDQLRMRAASANEMAKFVTAFPRTNAAVDAAVALAPSSAPGLAPIPNADPLQISVSSATHPAMLAALADAILPPARRDLSDRLLAALVEKSQPSVRDLAAFRFNRRAGQLLEASGVRAETKSPEAVGVGARPPRLGTVPGSAIELRAQIPRIDGLALLSRDPSIALGLLDGALVRLSGPALEPEWRLRLEDRDPIILWARDRIVAWQSASQSGDAALVIDPLTGTVVYSTPRPASLWIGDPQRVEPSPMRSPTGLPFQPSQVIPHCDGDSLVLVRRSGDIARFGVLDERPEPALLHTEIDRIYATGLYDGCLVIAGESSRDQRPTQAGQFPRAKVAVFDARTLAQRASFEARSGVDVRWIFATSLGEVFLGTGEAVERWTIDASGVPHPDFVTTDSQCVVTESPLLLGGSLLLSSRDDIPTFIPLFEGPPRTISLTTAADRLDGTSLGYLGVPEGAVASFRNRLLLFAPSTDLAGQDSSARGGSLLAIAALDQEILRASTLSALARQNPGGVANPGFGVLLERFSLPHGLRSEQPPLLATVEGEPPGRMLVVDDWVILSNRFASLAIPLPSGQATLPSGVDSTP